MINNKPAPNKPTAKQLQFLCKKEIDICKQLNEQEAADLAKVNQSGKRVTRGDMDSNYSWSAKTKSLRSKLAKIYLRFENSRELLTDAEYDERLGKHRECLGSHND